MNAKQLIFVTLPFMAACTTVKSSSIVTDSIFPEFSAVYDGETITVQAQLHVESANSGTFIQLDEGDRLEAQYGENVQELSASFGAMGIYSAQFDADIQHGEVQFRFLKNQQLLDGSIINLPENFDMMGPSQSASLSRDDMLDIRWAAGESDDEMHISIEGLCIDSHRDTVEIARGEYPLPVYALQQSAFSDAQESCEITVTLERRRLGVLDTSFDDGIIFGAQRRSATVTITQ